VIETGDGKPIAGAYTVFKELSDQLAAQKSKFDAAVQNDLPSINRQLTAANLKPLEVITTETK
jgi:hypothetical protein